MKKKLLIMFIVIVVGFNAYAQGISGGVKAGLNLAFQNYSGFRYNETSGRVAYHAGGFLSIKFSKSFGIQPELLFNSVGSTVGPDAFRYNYLSLPIMFKFNLIKTLSIQAGPQIGYLLAATYKVGNTVAPYNNGVNKLFETSMAMGLGLDLPHGLIASIRYNIGLTNTVIFSSAEIKNKYLQFSVGYKLFDKSKKQ